MRGDAPVIVEVAVVQVYRRIGAIQEMPIANAQGPFEPRFGPHVAQLVGVGQVSGVIGDAQPGIHRR